LYQSVANNYFEEYAKHKVHVAIVAIIVIRIINVHQMLNVLPAKHAWTDSVAQIVSIVTVHAGCLKFLTATLSYCDIQIDTKVCDYKFENLHISRKKRN